jgi:cytochrome P450
MRLRPTLPLNGRVALEPTIFPFGGGKDGESPIYIYEGQPVGVNSYSLHRRPEIYGEDVNEFKPERWEKINPQPYEYLPFGAGPRICPGQQLSMFWMAYTLVRIVKQFKQVQNRDPVYEFIEEQRIVVSSRNGIKVGLIPG